MSLKQLLSISLFIATFPAFAVVSQPNATTQVMQQAAAKGNAKQRATKSAVHQDEGQRIFDRNCSRCHTAPDGFSPRISGTVIRHMRVRASLSQQDEQELLRFLNP
jgi:cytochrome c5